MTSTDDKSTLSLEFYKTQLNEMKADLEKEKNELFTAETKYRQSLSDYDVKLEKLHLQMNKTHQQQEEKETKLINTTAEWLNIKTKLESSVVSLNQRVKLNVGGYYYETTIETLAKYNESKTSFFKALFSQQWELEKDSKDESIFIDRNGHLFGYILQYLRTGKLNINGNDLELRQNLITESEFYQIESLVKLLKINDKRPEQSKLKQMQLYSDSKILSPEHQQRLNTLLGNNNQQWKLIYRASRNGYTAKSFHQFCDNRGPTITVIRSKNRYIFGGFTTVPWSSAKEDKTDTSAFLFTLTNPCAIKATKYPICERLVQFAVSHRPINGPTFGSVKNGGSDIYLYDPFNAIGSRIFFSRTYKDTTGHGWKTFTGDTKFSCDDLELFLPISM